jgi:hypothetical protein
MTHAGRRKEREREGERDGDHITGIWCYMAINEGAAKPAKGTINESN